MNILFYFISQINPLVGGTERVADTVAHSLRERGHNVYFMSRIRVPGNYDIPCFFLPNTDDAIKKNIEFINNFCQEYSIDVIINEAGNTDDVRLFSKEHIYGVKIITGLHFGPYQNFKYYYRGTHLPLTWENPKTTFKNVLKWIKTPFNKRMHWKNCRARYMYMYQNSDYVVVLSPAYINEYTKIASLKENSKLISIYNPNSFAESETVPTKEKMVLSIGRLEFAPKKVEYLLQIWGKVQPKHPDWFLSICGEGPAKSYLENFANKNKIGGIRFEGNVKPEEYYKRASIMCMTSIYEGTPMVIMEAMQFGSIPMVYDTFAAARDMIKNGFDGYVIPPFDEKMYAEKLSELIDNEDLRLIMSKNAIKSSKRFDKDMIIDEWEVLINRR